MAESHILRACGQVYNVFPPRTRSFLYLHQRRRSGCGSVFEDYSEIARSRTCTRSTYCKVVAQSVVRGCVLNVGIELHTPSTFYLRSDKVIVGSKNSTCRPRGRCGTIAPAKSGISSEDIPVVAVVVGVDFSPAP